MKGKSLFLLVEELNKAERHQLLNNCKRSGDKRHASLYNLVKGFTGVKDTFEALLEKCNKPLFAGKKDEAERDKIQRRFIDFSVKEIEQVKLKNFTSENQLMRHYLLTQIYHGSGDESVYDRYLDKTTELSEAENNRGLLDFCLDATIARSSRIHTKKEIQKLRSLLIRKNALIQKNYHHQLSEIYNLLSVLQFEDTELTDELRELILTEEEADTLITLANGSPEEAEYLIAKARFQFFQSKPFTATVAKAHLALKKGKDTPETKRAKEQLAFVEVLQAFHFGSDANLLLPKAKLFSEAQGGTERFYFHLIRILDAHQRKAVLPDLKELGKIKMEAENEFRTDFLQALVCFLNKDFSSALRKLNTLAYVPNFQLSTWSKLLELKIHLEKENTGLCESLIGRLNRHFLSHKGKLFTADSNKTLFKLLSKSIKNPTAQNRTNPKENGLTCLHNAILTMKTA